MLILSVYNFGKNVCIQVIVQVFNAHGLVSDFGLQSRIFFFFLSEITMPLPYLLI